jgi:hypothetical protein
MSTLLVITPESTREEDSVFYIVVAHTGECLASHLCSHAGYAPHDLYFGRPERIKEWGDRFGEIEVKFIDETGIAESELIEKNKSWHEQQSHLTTVVADTAGG